jgi:hypothetical protein
MRRHPSLTVSAFIAVFWMLPAAALASVASGEAAFESGDYRRAFAEWREAAEAGDPQAQLRLGELYEKGLGTPQHFVRAHLYFNLAGAAGLEQARAARDTVAERMSPEMVAQAQLLASDWQPSNSMAPQAVTEAGTQTATVESVDITWGSGSGTLLAVLGDEAGKLRKLLQDGADPNLIAPDGDSLLMHAVRNSDINVVKVLLDAGADPNLQGENSWTPLKGAIYAGRIDVARLLLARGADSTDLAPDGLTALALAQRLGHADLITVLSR